MTDHNPVNAELSAVTIRREGTRITARIDGPASQKDWAASALHRAGFVPVLTGERFHRLPVGMTDLAEQRRAVTRAVDLLFAEGIEFSCDPDLIGQSLPVSGITELGLGDRIGKLTDSIAAAGHTREVVAALSELTPPATASWSASSKPSTRRPPGGKGWVRPLIGPTRSGSATSRRRSTSTRERSRRCAVTWPTGTPPTRSAARLSPMRPPKLPPNRGWPPPAPSRRPPSMSQSARRCRPLRPTWCFPAPPGRSHPLTHAPLEVFR